MDGMQPDSTVTPWRRPAVGRASAHPLGRLAAGEKVERLMEIDNEALRRLVVACETKFVLAQSGRILRENDPDRSAGPRLFIAGCPVGNVAYIRHDVSDRTSERMLDLLNAEPPWLKPAARPLRFREVMELLVGEQPVTSIEASLIYALPPQRPLEGGPRFICSGTDEGASLLERLQRSGLPRHLVDAGFANFRDFWAPWCVALDGDAIAAVAFAARLGERGAEVGVYTFADWRSRGLAAAVTAKWSCHSELASRELFYSTTVANASSQRVAARLDLQQFAIGLRVTYAECGSARLEHTARGSISCAVGRSI